MTRKSFLKKFLRIIFVCSFLICSTANSAEFNIPLFEAYPELADKLPYISLGNIKETPIIHVDKLDQDGTQLYVKNDGISGTNKIGKPIFSGNKRRKLEFLLADALAHNATHIYTVGAAGSNHATATAAYANELGLNRTLILGPQRNTRYTQRNLKLDLFYDANFVVCESSKARRQKFSELEGQKKNEEYFIQTGGSNEVGAIGYVNAAFELKKQIEAGVMPKPDVIYVPYSSAGTAAGFIVGCKAACLNIPIKVVSVDTDSNLYVTRATANTAQSLIDYARLISEHLRGLDGNFPIVVPDNSIINPDNMVDIIGAELVYDENVSGRRYLESDLTRNDRHRELGHGTYALIPNETAAAIKTLYDTTGIKLDGTYAGKAFAACLQDLKSGNLKGKTVLFWDTFSAGDFNEYTSTVDTKKLPAELQKYIDEAPGYEIQANDQGVGEEQKIDDHRQDL